MDIDYPEDANLDFFLTWKVDALKTFLEKRGLSKTGSKAELAALCFSANKMNIPIQLSSAESLKVNRECYDKLLKIDGNLIIPDPFKLSAGWSSEKEALAIWPPVYISDITTFFMRHCPDTTTEHFLNDYKVGKAYEYFANQWLKEVFYHPLGSGVKYCVLRASCTPSQRVSHSTDHKVWVCVEKTSGKIASAYCSCTAGLGQTCNHVAGILFRLEHANKMGLSNLSCTSLPCSWKIPNESISFGPKLISEMVVKKSKYGKSDSARPLVSSQKKLYQPLPESQQRDHLKVLGHALVNILPNACLFKGLKLDPAETEQTKQKSIAQQLEPAVQEPVRSESETAAKELESKLSLLEIAKNFAPGQESDFMQAIPILNKDERSQIEQMTRAQAASKFWHEARKGRITASKFYAVHTKSKTIRQCSTTVNTRSDLAVPLLKTLVEGSGVSADPDKCPRAIKHGRSMEPVAKVAFHKLNAKKHTNLKIKESGLLLHEQYQYLGASPDLLVSCSCCGEGVVEIKCPMIVPCDVCNPRLCLCESGKKLNYLEVTNGKFTLKHNHHYYGQIQGQLAISGHNYCDFFIYSSFANHQERIYFDDNFWQEMLHNLIFFFNSYMVPYMLHVSALNVMECNNEEPMEIDHNNGDTLQVEGHVFFCPLCNERIQEAENIKSFGDRSVCCDSCNTWHHFKCVKMSKSVLSCTKEWLCPSCKN